MSPTEERRYQVFVSSTFRDLQDERQKVLEAILELRSFPVGMEMFPSADDEQWQFIQREIQSCDYYVVVVAGKYGSISDNGLSFTEREYDYAIQCKKPVMGFLVKDLNDLKGSQLEDDQTARVKLIAFRKKVSAGKLVKFFQNPDELKAQVWHALDHSFRYRPQAGWVRAKNARRLEDLEEITKLQKRVLELEAENSKLRHLTHDPWEEFERANPNLEARVRLKPNNGIAPPVEAFDFKPLWREVFRACFEDDYPRSNPGIAANALDRLLVREVLGALPESGDWLQAESAGRQWVEIFPPRLSEDALVEEDCREILAAVQRTFLGFGLMESTPPRDRGGYDEWTLTPSGLRYGMKAIGPGA